MKKEFTIKELKDYSKCPMLYKLKYMSNLPKKFDISEKFENDLRKVAFRLFRDMCDKGEANMNSIKELWGNLWIKKKKVSNFVYHAPKCWRDNYNNYNKKGIKAIVSIFDKLSDKPGTLVIIDQDYSVSLPNGIKVTGTWDIVREVKLDRNLRTELISLCTYPYFRDATVKKDLKLVIESLAFRSFTGFKEDRVVCYVLDRNQKKVVQNIDEDYKDVIIDITSITKGINNNIFFRASGTKCSFCAYKDECGN